jgi:hypothetical protein
MLKVLSLGAGVQSSTVLLMSILGELPKLDAAIFADTQWEPTAVYEYLAFLERESRAAGIGFYRTTAGNIREDAIRSRVRDYDTGNQERWASMPLRVLGPDGQKGMIRRQCTKEYKVQPIRRVLRELIGTTPTTPSPRVELWMGISRDEMRRMRISDVRWIQHRYPLVMDVPMTRQDCLRWLERNGYSAPARSACIGCPYKSNAEWRNLQESPTEWADAVAFDSEMRQRGGIRGELYLHRDCVPLDQVDLSTAEERGQMNWLQECEGMCGV